MRRTHLSATLFLAALACAVAAARVTAGTAATSAPAPLATGVVDYDETSGPDTAAALQHIRSLGATMVRLPVNWSFVAPAGAKRPVGFDARNPTDPHYRWMPIDDEVRAAARAHLQVLLTLYDAPQWAAPASRSRPQDGPVRPDPAAFGDFVTAAAKRYSGRFQRLPRVRYWQGWNEPNVSIYLTPQVNGTKLVSPDWYRRMLNAFSDAVHAVNRSNVAIAGGLSPFTVRNVAVETIGPMRFLRLLLCMSAGAHPKPTCRGTVHVDAFAVHPYTSGDAEHKAYNQNDMSLGNLSEIAPLVRAAIDAKHLVTVHPYETWVTEFSWDSKPPDPRGVPMKLETRWVADALYRAWKAGVSHFFWFRIRDQPLKTSDFQSGLYYRGSTIAKDKPKPIATAFRFPFVAYLQANGTYVWGRTPTSRATVVRIQEAGGSSWRTVRTLHANRAGIFSGTLPAAPRTDSLRAVVVGGIDSEPFSLTVPKDYSVTPFGATSTG